MLVGREAEQQTIDGLLCRARDGRSAVLVVRGEPGIGKSALQGREKECRELCAGALRRGLARGSAYGLARTELAYGQRLRRERRRIEAASTCATRATRSRAPASCREPNGRARSSARRA